MKNNKEIQIKFENYLQIFLQKNQILTYSTTYIGGINGIMRKIVNDIINKTSASRRDLANELRINKITFDTWINGFYPYQVDIVFELLKKWKILYNKSTEEYEEKLNILFNNVGFFVPGNGTRIILPKYITSKLLYFIGYLYGDGFISSLESCSKNSEFALKFEEEHKTHLENVVIPIVKELFGRDCNLQKNKNANSYKFKIQSKILHLFAHKIFDMPLGKKLDSLKAPNIIRKLPFELKKYFIMGLFDADGYVTNVEKFNKKFKDLRISLFQKSEKLVEWVRDELKKEGIPFGNKVYKDKDGFLISTTRKESIIAFYNKLNLLHPIKKKRLEEVVNLLNKGWYSSIHRFNLEKAKRIFEERNSD